MICFYSLTKRFTNYTHVFLGLSLALAPVGLVAMISTRSAMADVPPLVSERRAAVELFLVAAPYVLAVAAYQSSPPPYQPSFGLADKQQLETLYPGGKFIGNDIYQRCEQGWQVKYYPDGRRLSFGTCWK